MVGKPDDADAWVMEKCRGVLVRVADYHYCLPTTTRRFAEVASFKPGEKIFLRL